jgi:hypothetical protein
MLAFSQQLNAGELSMIISRLLCACPGDNIICLALVARCNKQAWKKKSFTILVPDSCDYVKFCDLENNVG